MATPLNDGALGHMDGLDRQRATQSSFNFSRRARPPPMHISTGTEEESRIPLKPNKLQRRESKGGLRGMFTRNKTEKSIVSPVLEEAPPSATTEKSMRSVAESTLARSISIKRTISVPAAAPMTPVTPAQPTNKPSRMNLRSKSVKHSKPTPTPSKASPKSTKSSSKPPTRSSAAWDPPPLFQAYPQAIKHAQLSASTLSADSIIRISNHKRNNSLRDELSQTAASGDRQGQTAAAKKAERARSRHRRQVSGSISKSDWTQKIFVLVTSGYLLQYSGDGSFDRLPEKMMQLGKDSVAFASDVIPGKHWVLQISKAMDADGTPAADSRSLFSRLTFRGADYRRTATSLLLVLNSAEEMDSWIAVVRREIEALGGKKHVSETGKPKPDDKVMQLKAQPSHRYLVQRDPDQFSNPSTPLSPAFGPPPWTRSNSLQANLEEAASALSDVQPPLRPSTGHESIANSFTSHDGRQLESLRDSRNRLSYVSSGQRTMITSQASSPATSPTCENMSTFDDFTPKASIEDVRPRPNAAAINERRRSMQAMPIPVLEAQQAPKIHRHSTYSGPARPNLNHSPMTPNFSLPNTSSRRYSAMKMTPVDVPAIPTIITRTPSKVQLPTLKGARKATPPALAVARPLSPVEDPPSPERGIPVFTPTESSFKMLQQIKASVVDIPPRSPLPEPSAVEINPPTRRSGLVPPSSPGTTHIDFQFPRRHSSIQTSRDSMDEDLEEPSGSAPIPAAVVPKPLSKPPFDEQVRPQDEDVTPDMETERLSPLPILPNRGQKLRRPMSMQIRPTTLSPTDYRPVSQRSSRPPPISSSSQLSNASRPLSTVQAHMASTAVGQGSRSPVLKPISPSLQRLRLESSAKHLANRKSMPLLVNGPPPAPPPDCALPPLPPPGSGGLRGLGMRNPVRV